MMLKKYMQSYGYQFESVLCFESGFQSNTTLITAKSTFAPVIRVQNYFVVRREIMYIDKESYCNHSNCSNG